MTNKNVDLFIKNIVDSNYSDGKEYLQRVVEEKLANKIKEIYNDLEEKSK